MQFILGKDQEKESFINENVQAISLDNYLSDKVKLGKYQYKTLFASCLLALGEGANLLFAGLLLPLLMSNWGISREEQAILGSIIFGWFGVGALFGSFISSIFGRRKPLILSLILQVALEITSFFMPSFELFSTMRAAHSFFAGISIPISLLMIYEITPSKSRYRSVLLVRLCQNFGPLFLSGLLWAFLSDLGENRGMIWRFLILVCCFPTGIACLLSYHFLRESPYYYLILDKINERGFEVLDEMIKENNDSTKSLDSRDKLGLLKWCQMELRERNIKGERKQKFMSRTVFFSMVTLWLANSIIYYGIIYSIPTILKEAQIQDPNQISFTTSVLILLLMSCSLIFSNMLVYVFSDSFKINTKHLLIACYVIGFGSGLASGLLANYISAILATVFLFFINIAMNETQSLTLFISEHHRRAQIFAELISRIGGLVMPWIVYLGIQQLPAGMMNGFAVISFIAAIASLFAPVHF